MMLWPKWVVLIAGSDRFCIECSSREVISAYQKSVDETVRRFDGFVAKYMGDGVLIYFGYPHSHEDDAERAVRGSEVPSVGQRRDVVHGHWTCCLCRFLYRGVAMVGVTLLSRPTFFLRHRFREPC
jgi:hypothetical protein